MSDETALCMAIWNGCICGRPPHDDDRHVWLNTLDHNRAVDPARYPARSEPATKRQSRSRLDLIAGWDDDEQEQPPRRGHATERLDEAWAEAEAALPEGWMFDVGSGASQYVEERYAARAAPIEWSWPVVMVKAGGDTPAAALRALRAALAIEPAATGEHS